MNAIKTAIVVAAASTGAALWVWNARAADNTATGCEPAQQTITQVMGKGEITTYDEAGDFKERIPSAAIVTGVDVVACRESPSKQVKLQVKDKDKEPVWVDRLQVKISGANDPGPRKCKAKAPSDRNDATAPAVSGIDPCASSK